MSLAANPQVAPNARRSLRRAFFLSLCLHLALLAVAETYWLKRRPPAFPVVDGVPLVVTIRAAQEADVATVAASSAALAGRPASPAAPEKHPEPPPAQLAGAQQSGRTPDLIGILDYVPAQRLTQLPRILHLATLELPGVIRAGDSGRLLVEMTISASGTAESLRVIETTVPARFLANAMNSLHWAIYQPGLEKGQPVRARIKVEIVLGETIQNGNNAADAALDSARKTRVEALPQ